MRTYTEITYENANGVVHSDEMFESPSMQKVLIRKMFEEWLENSNGTGFFVVGDPEDMMAHRR